MTRFAIALVASVLCYAMPAAATEYDDGKMIPRGDNVVDAERKGVTLGSMLERLKPGGKPTVVDVEYSLSWIDAQPAPTGGEDLKCLAEALYFEARGETVAGQFAVAEVIVNRSKSSIFPDTICGVISQGTGRKYQCQFTYKCDGYKDTIAEKRAYERVSKVARAVLDGYSSNLTDGATYYHTNAVSPAWSRRFIRTATIGVHYFYRRHDQRASSE